jgi:hypothetical protein
VTGRRGEASTGVFATIRFARIKIKAKLRQRVIYNKVTLETAQLIVF